MSTFTNARTGETVTLLPAGDFELTAPTHCECMSDACLRLHAYEQCLGIPGDDGLCDACRASEALTDHELNGIHERRSLAVFDYRQSRSGVFHGYGVVGWIQERWNEERRAAFCAARRDSEAA
jgi:hypothetical protein